MGVEVMPSSLTVRDTVTAPGDDDDDDDDDDGRADSDPRSSRSPSPDRSPLPRKARRLSMIRTNSPTDTEDDDADLNFRPSQGMFLDPAAMKERLRQNMVKPEYDVCNFYKKKGWCQLVARSPKFENTTLFVIALNALWMAVDTDLNDAAIILNAHPVFQIADHFFCVYFFWEWSMRLGAFRWKRDGLRDAWFVFDTVLVWMMVGETWVMTAVILVMGDAGSGGGLGNASVLRLMRLLRLTRMARMAKLLRSMPELLILVKGIVSATRSVFFTLLLLMILLYIFAIAFRQLLDDTRGIGKSHFPTVIASMHTLFLYGTLLDSPGSVTRELGKESFVFALAFYGFALLAAFTVLNMLIGVLCEVVSAVAAIEKESITCSMVKEGVEQILEETGIDQDGDNMISQAEFESILDNPEAIRLLKSVDVDVYGLIDLSDFIFSQDSFPFEDEKQLSFGEFMDTVLSLRGGESALVKDIVDARKFLKNACQTVEDRIILSNKKLLQELQLINEVESDRLAHERQLSGATDGGPEDVPEDPQQQLPQEPEPQWSSECSGLRDLGQGSLSSDDLRPGSPGTPDIAGYRREMRQRSNISRDGLNDDRRSGGRRATTCLHASWPATATTSPPRSEVGGGSPSGKPTRRSVSFQLDSSSPPASPERHKGPDAAAKPRTTTAAQSLSLQVCLPQELRLRALRLEAMLAPAVLELHGLVEEMAEACEYEGHPVPTGWAAINHDSGGGDMDLQSHALTLRTAGLKTVMLDGVCEFRQMSQGNGSSSCNSSSSGGRKKSISLPGSFQCML
eukprot:TRINITY_DN7799_c0_g8_i1.p1 TRINITY_DN7799_c0_g8~~TRINITY_DN7799_c0_g8_i1.p1  ORF type:complete len:795 (-),score=181.08 TRINITY_DN7799_c0_g8_i1:103-2487(-)